MADPEQNADDIQRRVAAYLEKYWADRTVHAEMEAFLRANTMVEFAPEVAFGIIEREQEFSQRATRWRW